MDNVISGAYDTSRVQAINDMYAAQQKALEEQYKAAYDQQIRRRQAAADKIPQLHTRRRRTTWLFSTRGTGGT
ncbi:MAG: hypothetical protein V8T45_04150 [Oscillospiraceae bacterium]